MKYCKNKSYKKGRIACSTDRTDSYVSGTFSGSFYNFKDGIETKKIITEGKFHIKIIL